MKAVLTEEQKKMAGLLVRRKRALICSKTGAGKTLGVLVAFEWLKQNDKVDRLLVFGPKNAYERGVWELECKKYTTLKAISLDKVNSVFQVYPSEQFEKYVSNFDVIYCKHTHVKNSMSVLLRLKHGRTIIVNDECHSVKNPKSQLSILFRYLTNNAFALWGLTATVLSKDLEDSYHILNAIKPGCLNTFDWFRDNICLTDKVKIKVGGRTRELIKIVGVKNQRLLDSCIKSFVLEGHVYLVPKFHKLQYNLSPREQVIYKRIANGVEMKEKEAKDWVKETLKSDSEQPTHIKSIDLYSSRFIYLQYAADGILDMEGNVTQFGTKLEMCYQALDEIIKKGQSCVVYFEFYETLNQFKKRLSNRNDCKVYESSGRTVLKPNEVTEASCKKCSNIVLMTKAGSSSVSFYFINNIILVHIPTVPEALIQAVGRIVRMNSLFKDDLNVYFPQSENIDEYKLRLSTSKTEQMELVAGEEGNIPDWYRGQKWNSKSIREYKRYFLWK